MKVGFVGLGKMGLPIAVTMALKGHDVLGYDIEKSRMTRDPQPYREAGPDGTGDFNDWLAKSSITFGSLPELLNKSDIVFVAVQTPHHPDYEGVTPLPDTRVDFDYSYLRSAVRDIVEHTKRPIILCIMSTVLPGTMAREIEPLLKSNKFIDLVYNPSFIAMGTTMRDYLQPEFVLLGSRDKEPCIVMRKFYATFTSAPVHVMTIESAELAKVSYNTFISLKIAFANTVMEICDNIPKADCDEAGGALKAATRRLISPAYLDGGMGDGGGCHPRDNIAMSWLAREYGLSFDIFEAAMVCRERQARWLAKRCIRESEQRNLPIVILGAAFKPETDLIVGSPSRLVWDLIRGYGARPSMSDDNVGTPLKERDAIAEPSVFLIGCRHDRYSKILNFAPNSVVIDPHRYIPDAPSGEYDVIRIGESRYIPQEDGGS